LSKDNSGQTPWHKAAGSGNVEILEKLWDFAKKLQLKLEGLRNDVFSQKTSLDRRPGSWQQEALNLYY